MINEEFNPNIKTNDTNIEIFIDSRRYGGRFKVSRFEDYNINLDIEADADVFEFTFGNPMGIYTSLFSKYDTVDIIINTVPIIKGMIDTVTYSIGTGGSKISISGRDFRSLLIDNCVTPGTKKNIKPVDYITSRCKAFGINKVISNDDIPNIKEKELGVGESEMAVIMDLLEENRKKLWWRYDTLYIGSWHTNMESQATLIYGRDVASNQTAIESLQITEDSTDEWSEKVIYGSTKSGKDKIIGTAKNDKLIGMGITKKNTENSGEEKSASKYISNAKFDIKESFRNSTSATVSYRTRRTEIGILVPDDSVRIIDQRITLLDALFFVKTVTYAKNVSNGSTTTLELVMHDTLYNKLWAGQGTKENGGVTGIPKVST